MSIQDFFIGGLIVFDENFNDKEETIDTMCAVLYEKGYVNASYRNKIYEREQIASSAYDTIAIPHPLENKAERSIIAVCIEKKGDPLGWIKSQHHFYAFIKRGGS